MTEREALKMALEALEVANSCVDGYYIPKGKTQLPEVEEAITAIKEALAQQDVRNEIDRGAKTLRETYLAQTEQDPVAWRHDMGEENGGWEYFENASCPDCQPLYTIPPQQELVCVCGAVWGGQELIYTTPQRKPLSNDARGHLVIEHLGPNALLHKPMSLLDAFHAGIDAAEAAHGIKENT